MTTATIEHTQDPLADAFDLDLTTTDIGAVHYGRAETTNNGCGPSPTAGPTSGCVMPNSPAVRMGDCALI